MNARSVIGWDVGGAHLKACVVQRRRVVDVAQWACPLWQGLDRLGAALAAACERWPALGEADHAVTMTGEMVDLFADRPSGVQAIAAMLASELADSDADARRRIRYFAGDAGWLHADELGAHWDAVASANWLATARHGALRFGGAGVLVDIGSTTTDLIAFAGGRVVCTGRTDAQRLAGAELVYQGVVRTPLCALARRVVWRGTPHNVMNEFFATTADVYRLTGELDPAHDQQPSADGAAKDLPATRRRLARMIGLDASDGSADEWREFARAWRAAQVAEIAGQLRRVWTAHRLDADAVVVGAGCGDFLLPDVLREALPGIGRPALARYGFDVAEVAEVGDDADGERRRTVQRWAQVCAPSVAVATLFDGDMR